MGMGHGTKTGLLPTLPPPSLLSPLCVCSLLCHLYQILLSVWSLCRLFVPSCHLMPPSIPRPSLPSACSATLPASLSPFIHSLLFLPPFCLLCLSLSLLCSPLCPVSLVPTPLSYYFFYTFLFVLFAFFFLFAFLFLLFQFGFGFGLRVSLHFALCFVAFCV